MKPFVTGTHKRVLCALLSLLLVLTLLPCTAMAAQRPLQTVRVGFFQFNGYHMINALGERSGYGYELLQHMAGYTDWVYDYVGYDKSWSEMQNMLERGEIDLLTSAQKTEDRIARFDFSELPIGTSSTILTVKAGDNMFALRDYANWSGMRVGMIHGNSRNDDFRHFAEEKGFSYREVFYDSTERMVDELKEGGQIDAVLTSNLRAVEGEWIVAEFAPSPFYIMVQKGNQALLSEIDAALEQLKLNEPALTDTLMRKYYAPDSGDEIAYTVEERQFIDASQDAPLMAAVNPDRAPFSYYADGVPHGILVEMAAEIIRRSGLNVQYVETKDRASYRKLIESGGIDLQLDARYEFSEAERHGYHLTGPFAETYLLKLYRKNDREITSLALLRDSYAIDKLLLADATDGIAVAYYDTVQQVVDAVLTGKQDATYLYRRTAESAIERDPTNRLAAEEVLGGEMSFAVGIRVDEDPLLYSVLNKAVSSLDREEISAIELAQIDREARPFSLIGYTYDYPLRMLLFVVALFLMAGLAALLWQLSQRRKRAYAALVEEQRHSRLLSDALATAERADAAKSHFLSRVSHEMRTPLNAIIGFMELAKDADPGQVKRYLINSGVAAKQLLSVINDVLDMSSIESGKLKIAHVPFDFRQMLHSITNIYLAQCHAKGLAFETRLLTPVEEWLIGDQLRVNQILINLLGNAVKFTEKGHVWLSVEQQPAEDPAKVFLRFEISDTGCGMTQEMQQRLFKPFEQESATTAQKYGGSGLGLSIVKNLVGMMDGAIKVESVHDKGSVFTVDLPFFKSDAAQELRMPQDRERLHVLAVDDEPIEREYVSAVLKRLGVRHTCVQNGVEALSTLHGAVTAEDPYNLCLIDWKMPNMDGEETTRRIRERYGKDVVVIIVSAYDHNSANERAVKAGANLFLPKPLFQSSLMDLFQDLTSGNVSATASQPVVKHFAGKRVLMAEDNAMNRMVAEGLLKKLEIVCDTAVDGKAAVELFLAASPDTYDAILMDVQMPTMDGLEATRAIRASDHPEAKTVQIIALTANAFNEDVAKTLSSGMNAHVSKPIALETLSAALERAFQYKEKIKDMRLQQ